METLPDELRLAICGYLSDDRQSLEALQVMCKKFSQMTKPFIFNTIRINKDPKSWGKLKQITSHPDIRILVERILCETGVLPDLQSRAEWEFHARQFTFEVFGDQNEKQIQKFYENFQDWHREEQPTNSSQKSPEQLQLKLLTRLHSVETVSGTYTSVWTRSAGNNLSKKAQDTMIHPIMWVHDNTHIISFLQQMEEKEGGLISLGLSYFAPSILDQRALHVTTLKGAISQLRHLALDFQGPPGFGQFQAIAVDDARRFTDWLGAATELETFKLSQNQASYNLVLSLIQVLNHRGHTWPKLRTLHLTNTCDMIRITDFVLRHSGSLRELQITNAKPPYTDPHSWLHLIMRLLDWNLDRFTLRNNQMCSLLPRLWTNTFPLSWHRDMEGPMNAELEHIGFHGRSSDDPDRKRALGAYFPKLVRDETQGDYIEIQPLGTCKF